MPRDILPFIGPGTLAGLRTAFGPNTSYWHANTDEDAWADWLRFRAAEPDATFRSFTLMLIRHEAGLLPTDRLPLLRRVAGFLRAEHGRPSDPKRYRPVDRDGGHRGRWGDQSGGGSCPTEIHDGIV